MMRRKIVRLFSIVFFCLGLLSAIVAMIRLYEVVTTTQEREPQGVQEIMALCIFGVMFFLATIALRHAFPLRRTRLATYYKPKPNAEEAVESSAAEAASRPGPSLVASKTA